MPQFDVTSFSPQLFWLAVSFVVLLVLMYLVAVPLVGGTIDKRRAQINQDLERATKLKAEIDLVAAANERAITQARAEATALVKSTRDRLAHVAAEKHREVMAEIHTEIKAAEHRILLAKADAMKDVHAAAVDIVNAVSLRLVGTELGEGQVGQIVDDVIGGRA